MLLHLVENVLLPGLQLLFNGMVLKQSLLPLFTFENWYWIDFKLEDWYLSGYACYIYPMFGCDSLDKIIIVMCI